MIKASIIIIDYKRQNPYLLDLIKAIKQQTYKNYEIILVTDYPSNIKDKKIIYKSYGKYVGPAKKRDDGARLAKGEILVFIDDDAYPSKNWLKEIVKEFASPKVCAVGGPGVTPPNVSWHEEASGWASASPIGSGKYIYRFLKGKRVYVDDYPSMNLSVRKKDFQKVGGFDSEYWPGEDTKLCLDLVHGLGKKIIYNPKALVYHHRRPVLFPHLRQNGNFGLHRGFFARVLPKTSLKALYFAPPLLFLGLLGSPLLLRLSDSFQSLQFIKQVLLVSLFSYFLSLLINALWILNYKIKAQKLSLSHLVQPLLSIPVIFITHLWYGARFLQGFLFTDKLKR